MTAHSPHSRANAKRTFADEAWAFDRVERAIRQYQRGLSVVRIIDTVILGQIIHLRAWLRGKASAYRALAEKVSEQ